MGAMGGPVTANVDEAVGPDPVSGVRTNVASTVATQTLARVSVTLQRSNAMTLRTYLTDCVHHANTSVPVPPRFRRKWQPPARAGAAANAGQGRAVLADALVAA
jgi:hypothetical protein